MIPNYNTHYTKEELFEYKLVNKLLKASEIPKAPSKDPQGGPEDEGD